jgi:hypothetical protein
MMRTTLLAAVLLYGVLFTSIFLILTQFSQESLFKRRTEARIPLYYDQPYGKVTKISGKAEVQKEAFLGWSPLKPNQEVHWNDLVYVGENARLEILRKNGDALSLVGECIQRISDDLGLFPHLMRKFSWQQSRQDAVATQSAEPHYFFRLIAPHVDASRYLNIQQGVASSQRMTLIKNVKLRQVLRPVRDAVIIPSRFPTSVEIILGPARTSASSIGFLWNLQKQMAPEWTVLNPNRRVFVPLNEPGQFVFQVISEDEGEATRPLSLIVLGLEQGRDPKVMHNFSEWTRIYL